MTLLFASAFCWCALGGPLKRILRDQTACGLAEAGVMASETAFQDLTGIDQEMKAVSDLCGLRGSEGRASCIVTAAIATDNLYIRMRS
jgi:hypothetical protein